jgi:hypothetical protein|tara:strand:+ start:104 stop:382 length:279 start_codon:yes stop_codon:yes gene_type:complete
MSDGIINVDDSINIIINQTNYSKDKALEKLKEWDYNYMNVIREYLNPNFENKKINKSQSVNQMMMTEIRNLLTNIQKTQELSQEKLKLDSNN